MSEKINIKGAITIKDIASLDDVYFEPVDLGLYRMEGRLKNEFTIQVGVTEELKQEIEKLIAEGIKNK
ncbi:hypothetical protein [Granulicatella adiacens]|mgnify:FL=1